MAEPDTTPYEFSLSDTTYHLVKLSLDTAKTRTVYYTNANVTLYLAPELLYAESKGELDVELNKKLEKYLRTNQTTRLEKDVTSDYQFNYPATKLLRLGQAAVFDNKALKFVDTIYYRLERFGTTAFSVYYLPDGRHFEMVSEFSGILDNDIKGWPFTSPTDAGKEYDMLRSIGK